MSFTYGPTRVHVDMMDGTTELFSSLRYLPPKRASPLTAAPAGGDRFRVAVFGRYLKDYKSYRCAVGALHTHVCSASIDGGGGGGRNTGIGAPPAIG